MPTPVVASSHCFGATVASLHTTAAQPPFERVRALLRGVLQHDPPPMGPVDEEEWHEVLGLAYYHGVFAFIAAHVADVSTALPVKLSEGPLLRAYPRRVRAKNKFLAQELERIQQGLASRSVRALGFKGPPLAAFAYGSLLQRTCKDIDVLIAPEDLPVARGWLADEGYRYSSRVKGRMGERARQFFNRQHTFTRGESVFHIDLHTGIMPPLSRYAPDFDDLWSRRQTIQMEAYQAKALSPGDMLLVLCQQGLKDRWASLKHVLDVTLMIPHFEGQWPALLDRAAACHSRRVLLLGLYLAHEVLAAPLPDAVAAKVHAERRVQQVGRWAARKLCHRHEKPQDTLAERIQLQGLIQDSARGSVQYAFYAALRKMWHYTEKLWPVRAPANQAVVKN